MKELNDYLTHLLALQASTHDIVEIQRLDVEINDVRDKIKEYNIPSKPLNELLADDFRDRHPESGGLWD